MKNRKQIKAALIAIASIASFIGLVNFLKGNDFFQKGRLFYAIYQDVAGLEPSRPVLINGLKVGKVESIAFHPDKSGKLIVGFRIWSDLNFSKKSIATITESGLVAGPQINLFVSHHGEMAKDQDVLVSALKPSQLADLANGVDPIKRKLQKTLDTMDKMLFSLKSAAEATALMVGSNRSTLNSSLEKIGNTADIYKKLAMRIEKIPVEKTFSYLDDSLENLSQLIQGMDKGKGTLGKLVNDDHLYNQLNLLSKELELLVRDFRLHPKRYVHFSIFGKKNTPYNQEKKPESPHEIEPDSSLSTPTQEK